MPTCFPRTIIEVVDTVFHLLPRDLSEIRVLRKKLSKEAVGVFIDAALP